MRPSSLRTVVFGLALMAEPTHALGAVQIFAWQRAIAGMSAYCAATIVSSPADEYRLQDCGQIEHVSSIELSVTFLQSERVLRQYR